MSDHTENTEQAEFQLVAPWSGAFLLTAWRSDNQWRFVLVNVHTQERHAFAAIETVHHFLLSKLSDC